MLKHFCYHHPDSFLQLMCRNDQQVKEFDLWKETFLDSDEPPLSRSVASSYPFCTTTFWPVPKLSNHFIAALQIRRQISDILQLMLKNCCVSTAKKKKAVSPAVFATQRSRRRMCCKSTSITSSTIFQSSVTRAVIPRATRFTWRGTIRLVIVESSHHSGLAKMTILSCREQNSPQRKKIPLLLSKSRTSVSSVWHDSKALAEWEFICILTWSTIITTVPYATRALQAKKELKSTSTRSAMWWDSTQPSRSGSRPKIYTGWQFYWQGYNDTAKAFTQFAFAEVSV